jgi:hypothetical protein
MKDRGISSLVVGLVEGCAENESCDELYNETFDDCLADKISNLPLSAAQADYCTRFAAKAEQCDSSIDESGYRTSCNKEARTLTGEYMNALAVCLDEDCDQLEDCYWAAADDFDTTAASMPYSGGSDEYDCCASGDPCGYGDDGACDCPDQSWDDADCSGSGDGFEDCCASGDPCGYGDDGECDCPDQSWDDADCSGSGDGFEDCCASGDPCGYGDDGECDCPDQSWDDADCSGSGDDCCASGDPCGYGDDGECDCPDQSWDDADCRGDAPNTECDDCLAACDGLPSCCTGTGCMCQDECAVTSCGDPYALCCGAYDCTCTLPADCPY